MATDSKYDSFFNQIFYDFQEVTKLLAEDSKNDPENEPYKSKYAARDLLCTMVNNYKNISQDLPEHLKYRGMVVHGIILLHLGVIGVDTEEVSEGERFLLTCIELLAPNQYRPEVIIILLNTYNQMGLLWSNRDDFLKSKSYLIKAAILYEEFLALDITPVEFLEVLKPPEEDFLSQAVANFEKAYTLTLYYLAQLYASQKEGLKSAVYCHITLRRQLQFNDYDPIDWALNAATLSQYFMEKSGFKQARHHLAAATYIIEKYSNKLKEENDLSDSGIAKKEQVKHRYADVARCWTKYCIELLSTSKDRLMDESDNPVPHSLTTEFEKLKLEEESHVPSLDYDKLIFEISVTSFESQVTDQFILTFDYARAVFLNCQKWIDFSKEYYTLDGHASDYVEIIQDRSNLYRLLAFYEDDEKRQYAMHKRRTDMLEEVVQELNPEYYGDICRQIWFELGETYSDILDIKLDKLKIISSTERPTPQMLGKINHLVDNSIKNFKCFIDSMKEKATNEVPKKMRVELLRPLLLAFFHLGRLHNKYIVLDKKIQITNIEDSLSCYKKFIEYCEADEVAANSMKVEFQVCEEMVGLLPYKILKLQKEIHEP